MKRIPVFTKTLFILCLSIVFILPAQAQPLPRAWSYKSLQWNAPFNIPDLNNFRGIQWEKTGHLFTKLERNDNGYNLIEYDPANNFSEKTIVTSAELTPADSSNPLHVESYTWYPEHQKLIIFTNSKRVWRAHTRGDFWIYNAVNKQLFQLGKRLPESSLQFAKISPDGTKAAFVSEHNLYVEDLRTRTIKKLTFDGTEKIINGTFDWAYEEELFCRDGFRWSPDSKSIAYWQVNASGVRDYLMLNTTDSIYSFVVPVQYPKVGYNPSSAKIGVVNIATAKTKWMHIPGNPYQHYLPRMEWANNDNQLMVQQLNRRQDTTWLYLVNVHNGDSKVLYTEGSSTWIDINYFWQYDRPGWDWIDHGKKFLWTTEKDGWRHVYMMNRDGSDDHLVTKGNYDVMDVAGIDREHGILYFYASPVNATQQYLYKVNLNGEGNLTRISPMDEAGTHRDDVSPDGLFAVHSFSNHDTPPSTDFIKLAPYTVIKKQEGERFSKEQLAFFLHNPETFFQVTTADNVTMDGWMIKPANFDSTKKYPVLFYVYGEPASCTVKDIFSPNPWYQELADKGYVIISLDNRGTPAPKGAAWRHAINEGIGIINIRDQAMAAKKIMQWPWVDTSRIAVWGWSGGGSSTQNLMFQYPDIYKTGMAVAGVSNMRYYDCIYEERYMGLIPQDEKYYKEGSSVYHAAGLQGNLLIIHGSGDDNVHYQNQEALINALVAAGKQFTMMEYPNRTHGLSEGKGTTAHLYTLLTDFLETHCQPGAR